ncbi:MAG: hypothetical protein IT373_06975 [Polyangiaceae bacterium]|nr:hypothetical protein [Polyangiaceae bacterium]
MPGSVVAADPSASTSAPVETAGVTAASPATTTAGIAGKAPLTVIALGDTIARYDLPPHTTAGAADRSAPGPAPAAAAWRGTTRTAAEITSSLDGVRQGTRTVRDFVRWLGLDAEPATDDARLMAFDTSGAITVEAKVVNLDPDGADEWVLSITNSIAGEASSLYVLLDAVPNGLAAAGTRLCELPRGGCTAEVLPIHDARFSDLWITAEGSVSLGNASQQEMRSAWLVTLEAGKPTDLFTEGDAGENEVDFFRLAARPAAAPRVIERVRDSTVKRRYSWTGSAYK